MLKVNQPPVLRPACSGAGPRDRAIALFCSGIKAQGRFDHKQAVKELDRVYRLDHSFILALFEKAWSCVALGRLDEAARALRTVMGRHEELSENYGRVEAAGQYKKGKAADKSLLYFVYGDLVAQLYFQELVLSRVVQPTRLQECLQDPFLSTGAKMVLRQLKAGMDAIENQSQRLENEKRLFSFAVRNHFIHMDYHLMAQLESAGDQAAARSLRLLQIKLIRALPRIDAELDMFRQNLELKIAQSCFDARQLAEAKTWLEGILRETPNHIEAGIMLEDIMRLN